MSDVRFVGPSYEVRRKEADVQRAVNLFPAVMEVENGKSAVYLRQVPGLRVFSPLVVPFYIISITDISAPEDIPPTKPLEITWIEYPNADFYNVYRNGAKINEAPVMALTFVDSFSLGLVGEFDIDLPESLMYEVAPVVGGAEAAMAGRAGRYVGTIGGVGRNETNATAACTAHWGPGYNGVISAWGGICYRYIGGNYNFAQAPTDLVWLDNI